MILQTCRLSILVIFLPTWLHFLRRHLVFSTRECCLKSGRKWVGRYSAARQFIRLDHQYVSLQELSGDILLYDCNSKDILAWNSLLDWRVERVVCGGWPASGGCHQLPGLSKLEQTRKKQRIYIRCQCDHCAWSYSPNYKWRLKIFVPMIVQEIPRDSCSREYLIFVASISSVILHTVCDFRKGVKKIRFFRT